MRSQMREFEVNLPPRLVRWLSDVGGFSQPARTCNPIINDWASRPCDRRRNGES